MKVFKKVAVLTVALLSLGSSVAFGCGESASAPLDQGKSVAAADTGSSVKASGGQSTSGAATGDSTDKH